MLTLMTYATATGSATCAGPKPDISSISPSSGSAGTAVTLTGTWRTRGVQAVCFWRRTSGDAYSPYQSATIDGRGRIVCTVPAKPATLGLRSTVHVTVSVWSSAAGEEANFGECWSDWSPPDTSHGTHAVFTYSKLRFTTTTTAATTTATTTAAEACAVWGCAPADYSTCSSCPGLSTQSVCEAHGDHTGDTVCAWSGGSCIGCNALGETACGSATNCEWDTADGCVYNGRDAATSPAADSDGATCGAATGCADSNKPDIAGLTPAEGSPGDVVQLSGSWRTGPNLKAACFWRVGTAAYKAYLPGTITAAGDIECTVPERSSDFGSVAAPAAGDTVGVTVSVYDTSVGDAVNEGACWSDYMAEPGHGTQGSFTYALAEDAASSAGSSTGLVVGGALAGLLVVAAVVMVALVMVRRGRSAEQPIEVEVAPRGSLTIRPEPYYDGQEALHVQYAMPASGPTYAIAD